jgi:hypothetical protein
MLELILLILTTAGIIKAFTSDDDDSSSSEHRSHGCISKGYESYERIRVYPTERKAVRYYDGEEEEYNY